MKQKTHAALGFFTRLSLKKKVVLIVILAIGGYFFYQTYVNKGAQVQYQTAQAQKGTLVVSISDSGQVSAANSTAINTQMSGVVSKVYVQNGDTVKAGDKIAEISLDQPGQQKQQQALASYLTAKTNLDSANANLHTLQSQMFTKWQKYMDVAQTSTFQNNDGTPNNDNRVLTQFTIPAADWQAAQDQYKNQQAVIAQAQAAVNSAWLTYQQSSATITAPIDGTVTGLTLQEGTVLTPQSTSATTTTAGSTNTAGTSTNNGGGSQKVATIKTSGNPLITVNLSEIDAPNVKQEQKATITFDAFPGKTFTGHVFSLDTTGNVSSGVTTYPATIQLDDGNDSILPNMSATANIITKTKDNVLLVPLSAVKTQNGQATVRTLSSNNVVTTVDVTTGDSSDSEIEITSGLSEGDTVITGGGPSTTSTTGSAFGGNRGFGGFGGGGGALRAGGR